MHQTFQPAKRLRHFLQNRITCVLKNRLNQRASPRKTVANLTAYYWEGSGAAGHPVQDINLKGAFILVDFRWVPGTIVTMTLQLENQVVGLGSGLTLELRARVVRQTSCGVGVQFLFANKQERKSLAKFLLRIPENQA
jgi:hypothetical protein